MMLRLGPTPHLVLPFHLFIRRHSDVSSFRCSFVLLLTNARLHRIVCISLFCFFFHSLFFFLVFHFLFRLPPLFAHCFCRFNVILQLSNFSINSLQLSGLLLLFVLDVDAVADATLQRLFSFKLIHHVACSFIQRSGWVVPLCCCCCNK